MDSYCTYENGMWVMRGDVLSPQEIRDPKHQSGKLNDRSLEEFLTPMLREYLVRQGAPGIHAMKDEDLLRRVRYTFQDTRSRLARQGGTT